MNVEYITKLVTPLRQALFALGIGLCGIVVCRLMAAGSNYEWSAALVGLVFFSIMNAVISIFHERFMRYTAPSFYIYIGLLIVLLMSARFVSGTSIFDLREYQSMVLVVSIFYFMASFLVRIIRAAWEFAEEEER